MIDILCSQRPSERAVEHALLLGVYQWMMTSWPVSEWLSAAAAQVPTGRHTSSWPPRMHTVNLLTLLLMLLGGCCLLSSLASYGPHVANDASPPPPPPPLIAARLRAGEMTGFFASQVSAHTASQSSLPSQLDYVVCFWREKMSCVVGKTSFWHFTMLWPWSLTFRPAKHEAGC